MGPVVKQIMDHPRCAQLREGDIVLEVRRWGDHTLKTPAWSASPTHNLITSIKPLVYIVPQLLEWLSLQPDAVHL